MLYEQMDYLIDNARRLLGGCIIIADDGTPMYTPDGEGNYSALWTRDFAYMVESAVDLMADEHIEACIRYLLNGQRDDGCIPDRVCADRTALYTAGDPSILTAEPNIDNAQFLVFAVDAFLERMPLERRFSQFGQWEPHLEQGMDYIPRDPDGLVYNNPSKPHSPYGFTDTIGKTGVLLMESLLYWRACRQLERRYREIGYNGKAEDFKGRAVAIEDGIDVLWDDKSGALFAASEDCRKIDIWGNAYAVYIEFPLSDKHDHVIDFLCNNYARYVWNGQVRHLLQGEYWDRLLIAPYKDRYQNGAYWATASGWVMSAILKKDAELARRMLGDLVEYFKNRGTFECVTLHDEQLPNYVVSAVNVLGAVRRIINGR